MTQCAKCETEFEPHELCKNGRPVYYLKSAGGGICRNCAIGVSGLAEALE